MEIGRQRTMAVSIKIAMALVWWILAASAVWADQEGGGRGKMGVMDILLMPKIWVAVVFSLIGLLLLLRSKVSNTLRLVWLGVAFFAFAILAALPLGTFAKGMGLHPSPVCAITRPFQFLEAGRSIPLMFFTVMGVISVLSIGGNKLFCGWVCPLGAVQEIPQRIPMRKKLREKIRFTLPFKLTNTIRILVFVAFVPIVFFVGKNIYDYFNPFEFFHWGWGTAAIAAFVVTMIAAVFVFRPFCYLACPIGLYTWLLEHISLTRIRLNSDDCDMCEACVKLTNCPAVPPLLAGKKSRPDCHACGQCVNVCPKDALRFG